MKFNWVTLHIKDTARSRAFYGDLLGMVIDREFTQPGGRQFTFFRSEDGMQVELIQESEGGATVKAEGLSLGVGVTGSWYPAPWCWADIWNASLPPTLTE